MSDPHVKVSVYFFSVLDSLSPLKRSEEEEEEWDLSVPLGVDCNKDIIPLPSTENTPLPKPDLPKPTAIETQAWIQKTHLNPNPVSPLFLGRTDRLVDKNIEQYYQTQQRKTWKMPVLDKTQKNTLCLFVPFHDNGEDELEEEISNKHTSALENFLSVPHSKPLLQQGSHRRFTALSGYCSDSPSETQKVPKNEENPLSQSTTAWKVPTKQETINSRKHKRMFSMGDARTATNCTTQTNITATELGTNSTRKRRDRVLTRQCSPIRMQQRRNNNIKEEETLSNRGILQNSTSDLMRKVKLTKAKGILEKYSRATLIFTGSSFQSHEQSDTQQLSKSLVNTKISDKNFPQLCSTCSIPFSFTSRKHRCKNCNDYFCSECSSNRIKVPHKGYRKKVRVCDRCFTRLSELEALAEKNFLQTHRTILNSYKLVFFGPSGGGKTSFVQNSVRGRCPAEDELYSMAGVVTAPLDLYYNYREQDLTIPFHIWDINGNQRFFPLLDCYCSNADCCILAFDVTGNVKLKDLQNPWIEAIRKFDRTNTIAVLVGLKNEQPKKRTISAEEAKLFAKTQAMDLYLEASSRSGSDLRTVYRQISKLLIERQVRPEILYPPSPVASESEEEQIVQL